MAEMPYVGPQKTVELVDDETLAWMATSDDITEESQEAAKQEIARRKTLSNT